jgi:hypothetical protein
MDMINGDTDYFRRVFADSDDLTASYFSLAEEIYRLYGGTDQFSEKIHLLNFTYGEFISACVH